MAPSPGPQSLEYCPVLLEVGLAPPGRQNEPQISLGWELWIWSVLLFVVAREVGWQELSFLGESERRDYFLLDEEVIEYKLPLASGRMIRAHDSLM